MATWYIDSVNGSDSNNGLGPDEPACVGCGGPATEAHRRGGCFVATSTPDGFRDEHAEPVCAGCHDQRCDTRTKTSHDRAFARVTA
jgi:hypothetical protein